MNLYTDIDMGGCSIDKYGVPLTDEAIDCKERRCGTFGSGRRQCRKFEWYDVAPNLRPEWTFKDKKKSLDFCKLKTCTFI